MFRSLIALWLLLLPCLSFAKASSGKDVKTVIHLIETTDVHGNFYGYDFLNGRELEGGLPRVCTYVNDLRRKAGAEQVALLDAGDVLQGQPCVYYANFIDTLSTHLSSSMMNYMGYDAVAFGNHDIEAGHPVFDRWVRDSSHPMLGANIVLEKDGSQYLKPYTIIKKGGLRIAVLGLITPAIPMWLPKDLWSGLRFDDIVPTARRWAAYIEQHEKPDMLVGLFHTGLKGGSFNQYDENAAEEIALNVPGFDIIFYGHDHRAYCSTVKNKQDGKTVWLLNSGSSANKVAQADVVVSKEKGKLRVESIQGQLVGMDAYAPDKAFLSKYEPTFDKVNQFVNEQIGTLAEPIHTFDYFFGPSSMADLLHKVQLANAKADISLVTPLTFNEVIDSGKIYVKDIFKLYRYENRLNVFRLTGREVRGALERAYDLWTNTMHTASDHALNIGEAPGKRTGFKQPSFLFMSAAGITYTVDLTKPDGSKVTITKMSDGTPFDASKTYRVVVNSYIGSGGGGLLTEGGGISLSDLSKRIVWTSDKDLRYYVMEFFRHHNGPVSVQPLSDWQFVPADWTRPALERDKASLSGK